MDFDKEKVIVRRELRAPEIDEYDEIKFNKIIWDKNIDIGDYIDYKL